MNQHRDPIILILGIPRSFEDALDEESDALDFEIKGIPLLKFAANSYGSKLQKIIVARIADKVWIESLGIETAYLERETKGALATIALVVPLLDDVSPIIVQPFDGIVTKGLDEAIKEFERNNCSVGLITFDSDSPEFSYVRVDGLSAVEIAEKQVISNKALTGVIYFRSRKILLECIRWSLLNKIQTNGRYYLAPSINAQIALGKKVSMYNINQNSYHRFTNFTEAQASKDRLESISGS
jgi:NDP-sugar pyrophosphorylase family protein